MTLTIGAILIGSAVFFMVLAAASAFDGRKSPPVSPAAPGSIRSR